MNGCYFNMLFSEALFYLVKSTKTFIVIFKKEGLCCIMLVSIKISMVILYGYQRSCDTKLKLSAWIRFLEFDGKNECIMSLLACSVI